MGKKITLKGRIVPKNIWTFEVRDAKTGELKRTIKKHNRVPTVGLEAIAAQFGNSSITKDIGDNQYIAVGDDPTAESAGDTTLANETARKAIGSKNDVTSGVASISVFFASGEATGTHREFGLFGDGDTTGATSSADSGILFSRTVVNVAVAASETLTITVELTFTYVP